MKDKIIDGFNNDKGFIKNNNFKLIELSDKVAKISYEVNKTGQNAIKIVHGGLLFGLADTAAGTLACMNGKFPVTVSANINYLNPAKCNNLIAIAKPLKVGNSLGFYKVDIFDENELLICTSHINMHFK